MKGHGKAVVCAVGKDTMLAKLRGQQNFEVIEEVSTFLDMKLDNISQ
jgi:hypothetical protein